MSAPIDNLKRKLDEIASRCENATSGPYHVTRVDFDHGDIAYEVCTPRNGLHVAFYEHNCLDQGISAKTQAELYAHARTDVPKLLAVIEKLIEQRDSLIEMNEDDAEYVVAGTKSYANTELLTLMEGVK
jgi:hypothetical protein